MKKIFIDSGMAKRGKGPPRDQEGRKMRDYGLYEVIDEIVAFEIYRNRKPVMTLVHGIYERMDGDNCMEVSPVRNNQEDNIRRMLKKRGYKEPIGFPYSAQSSVPSGFRTTRKL